MSKKNITSLIWGFGEERLCWLLLSFFVSLVLSIYLSACLPFIFSLKIDSTIMEYIPDTVYPSSTFFSSPWPSLSSRSSPPSSPFRKEQASKRQQSNTIKQNTIKQHKSPHSGAGHDNPVGGKESQKAAKESETHTFSHLGVNKNTKLTATTHIHKISFRPI